MARARPAGPGPKLIDAHEAHAKGARHELFAATYYVGLGQQVYWPQIKQGPVDFILERDGLLHRVQTKGAWWNTAGAHRYLQVRTRTTNAVQYGPEAGRYDLVVVVFEQELWEIPAPLIQSSNLSLRSSSPNYKGSPWDKFKKL